jgi:hypothetical protein
MVRLYVLPFVLGFVLTLSGACTRPVTVESVQRDVPTTGTKLLNATTQVQDAVYASVKAKVISPQDGIAILDKTEEIGRVGQRVAGELDKLDLLIQAGKIDGPLVTQIVAGLTEMSKLYPDVLTATLPPQVATAVKEAQALIQTLQDTIAKLRAQ